MKLITKDTGYAIRALNCISGVEGQIVTVSDLAERLDIPRPFLRKILQVLKKKGILNSYKGKNGGFVLSVDPEKITVLGLIEIFQGKFCLKEHVFYGKRCSYFKNCSLKKKIDILETRVAGELKAITIGSLT